MSRFAIQVTSLPGLVLVRRQALLDERGFFCRLFCAEELFEAGWHKPVAQINHSRTLRAGMVRGMHFQHAPCGEMKLVSCVRGEVWDVAVDVRAGSPTFLHWHAELLTAENQHALLIPEGFAHGFQALSDDAELVYCTSSPYCAEAEAGLNPLDAKIGIAWPLPVMHLSEKDAQRALVDEHFQAWGPACL